MKNILFSVVIALNLFTGLSNASFSSHSVQPSAVQNYVVAHGVVNLPIALSGSSDHSVVNPGERSRRDKNSGGDGAQQSAWIPVSEVQSQQNAYEKLSPVQPGHSQGYQRQNTVLIQAHADAVRINRELRSFLAEATAEISRLGSEHDSLREEVSRLCVHNVQLRDQHVQITGENAQLKSELLELMHAANSKITEAEELARQNAFLSLQLEEACAQRDSAMMARSQESAQSSYLRIQNQSLQNRLNALIARTRNNANTKDGIILRLQGQIAQCELIDRQRVQRIQELEKTIDQLRAENATLAARLVTTHPSQEQAAQ